MLYNILKTALTYSLKGLKTVFRRNKSRTNEKCQNIPEVTYKH